MKLLSSIFLFVAATAFIASCKKDPVTVPGGTVRLIVNVNHHGFPIANARVFRKNGTLVYPGADTTLYDKRYVTDGNGNLTIDDVGNGQLEMVLYAKGVDPSWDSTTVTPVSGYQFIDQSTVTGENKDFNVNIPVSE